jgi:SAM-dependent methyltransferase
MLEGYYKWPYRLFKAYMGQRILDAGCGLGNFTDLLKEDAEYVLGVDLSPMNIQALRDRFKDWDNIEIAQGDLEAGAEFWQAKQIDTIVCLDLLEHVRDDISLLRSFFGIIQEGGHLLLKAPACKWLFGSIDIASAHYRRYTPGELRRKAEAVGWETIRADYMNIAGVIPYWVKSRILKKELNFSRTFRPWQLKVVERIVPLLKSLDRITGPPIGQAAILIARRPKRVISL